MTYTLRAGELDRRVSLFRRELTAHPDTGELIPSSVVYATAVPARVVSAPGSEYLSMNQVVSEVRKVFVIRWRSGVVVTDRVLFEGVEHDIQDIRELGRRTGLELHTRAVQ